MVTVEDDPSFPSKSVTVHVPFGGIQSLDLSTLITNVEYTVISQPQNGAITIDGSTAQYQSYTWLMSQNLWFNETHYVELANDSPEDMVINGVKLKQVLYTQCTGLKYLKKLNMLNAVYL